ncbi:MAG: UDP-2-acetamido-2-deoxy-3-oxo-D-glucuronate aminotransferase, partial [Alphaproteobacteria bacterium MarineAlpha8_Bin1]
MKNNQNFSKSIRNISFSGIDIQLNLNKKKIIHAISKTLENGQYIMGPEVKKLELELSSFCNSKYSITCANGTDAITLALMGLNFGANDYIVTPAFGFISTVESPTQLGIKPIFVDINKDNFSININELKKIIVKAKKENIK